jgi:hypothetical protein
MTTALEDREFPMLTCAETYPLGLRHDAPLTVVPEASDAPEADTPEARPAAGRRALAAMSRIRALDGDAAITWAMTGAAAAVILFAAIVSYSHIHGLATGHREDSVQSHLLPLSIDGVIAEASLVLLFAARHKLDAPKLARVMLWTGIVATLAANAVVALPPAWISPVANVTIGAVLSAWPAAAFIASVELIMLLVRDVRAVASSAPGAPETVPEGAPGAALDGAPEAAPGPAPGRRAPASARRSAAPGALRAVAGSARKSTRSTPLEKRYAAEIKSGELPSIRQIRRDMKVGQDRAKEIRADLETALADRGEA